MTSTPSAPVLRGGRIRLAPDLRQLDVLQERADRRQLGAREVAEAAELGYAEFGLESALAGEAIEVGRRHGRDRRAGNADPALQCSWAHTESAAMISPGESRTSSPGRSAPPTSPTSHSPVEMSSEASAKVPASSSGPPGARNSAVR